MSPRKSSPAKPAAPKKKSGKRFSGVLGKLLLLLVLVVLIGGVYLVARNYVTGNVREEVESIVGELDSSSITMRVPDAQSGQALLEKLRNAEKDSWGIFEIRKSKVGGNSIKLEVVLNRKSYDIEIQWESPKAPPKPKASIPKSKPGVPKLAIIIDDMGGNLATAKEFLSLPIEVTPAVIPHLAHSTEVAHLFTEKKRPLMLHMPMEPRGYPNPKPGEGAIMTGDSPDKVKTLLAKALVSVPGVAGINNHMGSKATESKALMAPVMEELAKRDLFFIDSGTSEKSIAASLAKANGVNWASRNVFLDNEAKGQAIEAQLALAVAQAKKNGMAIAIGHDRPETLKTLHKWAVKARETGVEIVPATEVLH